MKFSHLIVITAAAMVLSACNFSLAEDITPPPDYVPPTPMPTLGALYPAEAPNLQNGAAIYSEKCAPCHGETGMGDGEQGKQLPVPVAALGLPETARKSSPAQWFTTVSQGNLDRFMPPFTSLDEQERWDVVAYALTLHTTSEEAERGRALYQSNCAECVLDFFMDREKMAALSNAELVRILQEGNNEVPALGGNLSEDELWAVAGYLRSLTTVSTSLQATTVPSPQADEITPIGPEGQTPSVQGTPLPGTPQAEVQTEAAPVAEGVGTVSGLIENKTGQPLAPNLTVTLLAYEHGADPNTGPQEILNLEGAVQADGSFLFEDMDLPESRIFIAQATHEGIRYQSGFAVVQAGDKAVTLPAFAIYATTEDSAALKVDTLQIFFDYANESSVQIFSLYSLLNTGDRTILVKADSAQQVPFIKFPQGSQNTGLEPQDSAGFVSTADGFAIPPSETPYGLIAFASLPKDRKIEISQPAALPIGAITLFLPEGVRASGETLKSEGTQTVQNTNFNIYTSGGLESGASLDFTLSGSPKQSGSTADLTQNQTLLIGAGMLGLALILAGGWMFWRDKRGARQEIGDEDSEFKSAEEVMDAIIALDDLQRAGKLNEAAHKARREELMARLKDEF